ncbi:MAG: hypothetical protein GEU28_05585 [Dehalococcoidia bacterium]|nr:hypothetical protein [Dehalococcoidia bacterium]
MHAGRDCGCPRVLDKRPARLSRVRARLGEGVRAGWQVSKPEPDPLEPGQRRHRDHELAGAYRDRPDHEEGNLGVVAVPNKQGLAVQPVLPAPSFNRAGDFIFVSSIFPIDGEGNVAHTSSFSPFVGESEMAAQTRAVLSTLRKVLDDAGTTLDQTLKVEAYLVDPADLYEFKLVWKEFFPSEPPARTTAGVNDEHIIPGCLLNLHAVALAGDSQYRRETIHVDDVPNPMEAEWVPQAIKAGPFVFPSIVPATDFKTGIPVGKLSVYPYYWSADHGRVPGLSGGPGVPSQPVRLPVQDCRPLCNGCRDRGICSHHLWGA